MTTYSEIGHGVMIVRDGLTLGWGWAIEQDGATVVALSESDRYRVTFGGRPSDLAAGIYTPADLPGAVIVDAEANATPQWEGDDEVRGGLVAAGFVVA